MKKIKSTLSKRKHAELAAHVDNEGFFYYMAHYGPDLRSIEKLGFDIVKVKAALALLSKLETAIYEGSEE